MKPVVTGGPGRVLALVLAAVAALPGCWSALSLVSHWPVETTSAKALATGLFRRQAAEPSLSRAEALC